MFARLLLLFLLTPVVELALLIKLGELIGFWYTIALILVTGVTGSYLARREGLSVWRQFNRRLAQGGLPGKELVDGVIVLVAGALLITPGVLTDVVGFVGLIPLTRALIRKAVMKRAQRALDRGAVHIQYGGFGPAEMHYQDTNADQTADDEPNWEGRARDIPRHEQQ